LNAALLALNTNYRFLRSSESSVFFCDRRVAANPVSIRLRRSAVSDAISSFSGTSNRPARGGRSEGFPLPPNHPGLSAALL
ncbi:MAG: hypothetical protein DME31_01135, partial [Verrucomicrobia bacterium]